MRPARVDALPPDAPSQPGVGLLSGRPLLEGTFSVDQMLRVSIQGATNLHAGATNLHAGAPNFVPTAAQVEEVFDLMRSLRSAQTRDDEANGLTDRGALGGPEILAGLALTGSPGFSLCNSRANNLPGGGASDERRAVARGQALFNTKRSGCHNSPNRGNSAAEGRFIKALFALSSDRLAW